MANSIGVRLVPDENGGYRIEPIPGHPNLKKTIAGSKILQEYLAVYDDGHNRRFVKDKKVDQYARIQSFESSCLLSNIIKRFTNGDPSALQKVRGMYCDVTGLPCDSRSAHDIINRSRGVFDALPEEEKKIYYGDFKNFLGSFSSTAGIDSFVQKHMKVNNGNSSVSNSSVSDSSVGGVNNES